MNIDTSYDNKILDTPDNRYIQIYKITNLLNNKLYIGQCVSHILNHGKYRPYGYYKRFLGHISESKSCKKNQCHILNNALRKYKIEDFKVEIIDRCLQKDSDKMEHDYILKYNSLFPNGYNIKLGGTVFVHTNDSKKKLSDSGKQYFIYKKIKKVYDIDITKYDFDKIIKPLNKHNTQYGWYLYFRKGIKIDFGGQHTSLEDSKRDAKIFFNKLILNNSIRSETP
jgi:hypothetical protein